MNHKNVTNVAWHCFLGLINECSYSHGGKSHTDRLEDFSLALEQAKKSLFMCVLASNTRWLCDMQSGRSPHVNLEAHFKARCGLTGTTRRWICLLDACTRNRATVGSTPAPVWCYEEERLQSLAPWVNKITQHRQRMRCCHGSAVLKVVEEHKELIIDCKQSRKATLQHVKCCCTIVMTRCQKGSNFKRKTLEQWNNYYKI